MKYARISRRGVGLGLMLLALGCSARPAAPSYDSNLAEKILREALDAWQDGRAVARKKDPPPIRFEDEDYRNGLQLIQYRVELPSAAIRPFEDVAVALSLCDRQGMIIQKRITYQITLEPEAAVLRSD